jgi:hypothetical protein
MSSLTKAHRQIVVGSFFEGYDGREDLRVCVVAVVQVELEGYEADGTAALEVLQLRAPCVWIWLCSDSAFTDVVWRVRATVVKNLGSQHDALPSCFCLLFVGVGLDGCDAIHIQHLARFEELGAASRYVFGVEDAGGGCRYGAGEEGAVEHPHGAVDRRGCHVCRRYGFRLCGLVVSFHLVGRGEAGGGKVFCVTQFREMRRRWRVDMMLARAVRAVKLSLSISSAKALTMSRYRHARDS